MKQKYIIALIITMNCIAVTAQNKFVNNTSINKLKASHQKEQALGKEIFTALKEKNSNYWISLYPTDDEYKTVLELMLTAKTKGLTQQSIYAMIKQRKIEASGHYKAEFQDFIKQADSLGINWKNAVFQKFDFDAVYPEKIKLKYLNGDIWFSCKHMHFVIEGIEALELESGYRLQSVKGIRQVDDGD